MWRSVRAGRGYYHWPMRDGSTFKHEKSQSAPKNENRNKTVVWIRMSDIETFPWKTVYIKLRGKADRETSSNLQLPQIPAEHINSAESLTRLQQQQMLADGFPNHTQTLPQKLNTFRTNLNHFLKTCNHERNIWLFFLSLPKNPRTLQNSRTAQRWMILTAFFGMTCRTLLPPT